MSDSHLRLAQDIAAEAGSLLKDHFTRGTRASPKGRFDVVTDADHASEALIVRRLRATCPSHSIEAEESGAHRGTSSAFRWYVDPLDGTKNFARSNPAFAVSLAMEHDGELVVGVVFDPMRGEMFAAERGAGASCNDQSIRTSSTRTLEQCLLTTGFPSARRHQGLDRDRLLELAMGTQGIRRTGSSALDLACVASGRVDAFWDVALSSWDIAAGALLVAEAGGRCSDLRGAELSLARGDLIADNGFVHDTLVRLLGGAVAAETPSA